MSTCLLWGLLCSGLGCSAAVQVNAELQAGLLVEHLVCLPLPAPLTACADVPSGLALSAAAGDAAFALSSARLEMWAGATEAGESDLLPLLAAEVAAD